MNQIIESAELYWNHFLSYLPVIGVGLLVLIITLFVANWLAKLLRLNLNKRMDDPLLVRFLTRIARFALIVVGALLALRVVGLGGVAAGVLAGAGLSAFVLGFALKDIAENFLAGIILSFNRPFDMHDTITVSDNTGQVISLDFRTTLIKTFDGKDIYMPNAIVLKEPVTNYTRDGFIRLEFVVGIDYDDDIAGAIELVTSTLLAEDEVLKDNPPYVVVDQLATSTVNLRVYFWADTTDYKKGINLLRGRVVGAVKNALLGEGYGLPADIQEIKIYKSADPFPIKLTGAAPAKQQEISEGSPQ